MVSYSIWLYQIFLIVSALNLNSFFCNGSIKNENLFRKIIEQNNKAEKNVKSNENNLEFATKFSVNANKLEIIYYRAALIALIKVNLNIILYLFF